MSSKLQRGKITEFPPTAGRLAGMTFPIGGGYFRLLPQTLTRLAVRQVNENIGPAMFYIHPWEIDPLQPRIEGTSLRSRFRHYVNLSRTELRLRTLLREFPFASFSEVLKQIGQIDSVNADLSTAPSW